MIKVAVDAFGGDNSPLANVSGTVRALNEIKDLEVFLVGKEDVLNELLAPLKFDKERLHVVHASEIITCNDKPTEAIKTKKDSSLCKCIELMKGSEDINALVSVGSTGAILAGAVLKIGRIRGVKRPAFCPILPTMSNSIVGICDSGANVDCDSLQLSQFALMGSLYLNKAFGVENPKVALLNIGAEEEKGDMLRKETYQVLKNSAQINFVGNMESRDLITGKYDLVVCDGFAGNVLLKSTEGACMEMMKMLKKTFMKNLKTKIGAALIKKEVYALKDYMDYNNYGGAVLLGCAKTVVKGHGSSKDTAIYNCIKQAYNMEKNNLRESIAQAINTQMAE